mgnify:CR=1 FL=1
MKYAVRESTKFRKDLKRLLKRGLDRQKLLEVVRLLASGQPLPPKYKDHALTGDLAGLRDCHIQNDWVLLYKIEDLVLVLTLVRTGTHSDLGL